LNKKNQGWILKILSSYPCPWSLHNQMMKMG
jgi:hypothetical protein